MCMCVGMVFIPIYGYKPLISRVSQKDNIGIVCASFSHSMMSLESQYNKNKTLLHVRCEKSDICL
jgi:hypothetical protein